MSKGLLIENILESSATVIVMMGAGDIGELVNTVRDNLLNKIALKKFIGYIKTFLLIAFLVFLYGFSTSRNKLKKIDNIDIIFENGDNLFITYEMVNKLLIQKYDGLKSQPKENILLNKLEEVLLSNEMIENAEVFLSVDGELGASYKAKNTYCKSSSR